MNHAATIAGFLSGCAEMMRGQNMSIAGYTGVPDFLGKHGRVFKPIPLPSDVRQGGKRRCFENCAKLATTWGRFTYCEGYAAGIIPVLHAWVTDAEGNAIDPTWTGIGGRPELGFEYFGVAIKTSFLIDHLLRCEEHRPLIDDWSNNYPILHAPTRAWKA